MVQKWEYLEVEVRRQADKAPLVKAIHGNPRWIEGYVPKMMGPPLVSYGVLADLGSDGWELVWSGPSITTSAEFIGG